MMIAECFRVESRGPQCAVNCLNDLTCILSLFLFSDLNILVWIQDGFLEDVSEPGKASTTSHTAQWIGMLALQGSCNSCSGLAYSTVGGY